MMKLGDIIKKDTKANFLFFRDTELWYETTTGFQFPVPIKDTGTAVFKNSDKAIYFMRWIRKHKEFVDTYMKVS